ncbi:MAG: LysR family transcriptional regulator [Candidatus Pelagadaptatus aseana]|uniref:LysR family transcriptional regulator n=1 Tax=Candidatus Pelagadaptatus aseana TaxID=3120508 RepID=UPI0039B2BC47
MILYNHMAIFARVVMTGSFTRAAEQLSIPKSTVSQKVAQLESQLGVRLLQRTTRQLSLTEQGESFYQHCQNMLQSAEHAIEDAQGKQAEPSGKLKISAPVGFNMESLAVIISRYNQLYPRVSVEIVCSNGWCDLIKDGFDVALRAGPLQDSTLICRELRPIQRYLVASPDYLKRFGEPKSLQQLMEHQCIVSRYTPRWSFVAPQGSKVITPPKTIEANDLILIKQLALQGSGIAVVHDIMLSDEITTGQLQKILTGHPLEPRNLNLVYPSRELQSTNLKRFIDVAMAVYSLSP